MTKSAWAWLTASTLAAALAACGDARPAIATSTGASAACIGCHGGTDNGTGAPPMDTKRRTATTERGVGAHTAHVTAGPLAAAFDCSECHPKPATVVSPGHMDGVVAITWGSLASAGGGASWDPAAATCSVYCHGSAARGGTNPTPEWTRVDGTQSACGACHGLPPPGHVSLAAGSTAATCSACHPETVKADGTVDAAGGKHVNGAVDGFRGHPAGWMTIGSATHHASAARPDVNACLRCHAPAAPARVTTVTCERCHEKAGAGDFTMSCSSCHGSAANAAPPRDTLGNTATTATGVGAHQAHVLGSHGITAPLACVFCHPMPAAIASPGHDDGTVNVTGYTGTDPALLAAVGDPGWNRATQTCATSYCHAPYPGAGPGRGAAPRWTQVDGTQAACGTCHGLPPLVHPGLAAGSTVATCSACHPETVTASGSIDVAGGAHLNGKLDGFPGHPPGWAVKGSATFHGPAAAADVASCQRCHTARPPAQVSSITCASCHDAIAGGGDWTTTCTGCHGSTANAAPPEDLQGNTASTAVGVGAHQSHLTAAHGVTVPLDCTSCHPKPANALAPPHLDGRVEVTGYTGSDAGLLAAVTDPGWSRAAVSCATSYCHGATLKGGTATRPVWTSVDGTQAACGACHGLPPPGHPALAAGATLSTCSACHPETVKPDGTLDAAGGRHLNGRLDGFVGHGPGFADPRTSNFHGIAIAASGVEGCWQCHAAKPPATISALTCAGCHDALAGGADWTTSCFGCHGDRSANSAPPKDTHGNLATTAIGVGAHQAHVTASHGLSAPLDCVFCHVKPASVFAPAHFDGRTAVTGYTGADAVLLASVKDPGWNRASATCATSWCHGSYSGTFTYLADDGSGTFVPVTIAYSGKAAVPRWNQVDGTQGACGTCHDAPPRGTVWHSGLHPGGNACDLCHPGVNPDGSGFVDASRHVNGQVEVVPVWRTSCFTCH
jgi:predicted CxxxxCH...CXXCH cytochrome family protein